MAWHKQQQYDPTEAFIQNARQQKLLELELQEIDKLWFLELKRIAKDRLDVTSELTKLEEMKRGVDYYDKTMHPRDLKKHTAKVKEQFRHMYRENTKDNFNFETSAMKEKRLSVSLPSLNDIGLPFVGRRPSVKPTKKKNKGKHRKQSTSTTSSRLIKSTRLKSISDSNLNTSSDFKEIQSKTRVSPCSAHVKRSTEEQCASVLPRIGNMKVTSATADEHRYLKQRMATTLELPPVLEVITHRKMSV